MVASTAAAADVDVDVRRNGGVVEIDASAVLKADPATAWRVLTDYARYAAFVPGMRESRVVERCGTHAIVVQSGEPAWWFMHTPIEVTYDIREYPPSRVESSATADALRLLESSYRLTPAAAGVRIDYEGRLAPRAAWIGRIQQFVLRQAVVAEFHALADEIEREATAGR